jgi:hypothetical protein
MLHQNALAGNPTTDKGGRNIFRPKSLFGSSFAVQKFIQQSTFKLL